MRSSVSGISTTSNQRGPSDATVSETPSTVIDPRETSNGSNAALTAIRTRHSPPSVATASTSPTSSTCPCTRCPPSKVAGVAACSRFTRDPAASEPSVVARSV